MASVVLGYDDSPGSKAALAKAIDLAKTYGDRLVIGFGFAPSATTGEEFSEHQRALRELGEKHTAEALTQAASQGVDAEVELVAESPSSALLDLAERHDARFIVVGSYGESPIKGAILGSTPHKLLHLAETPVVVVPA